jgi:hypothetical protein
LVLLSLGCGGGSGPPANEADLCRRASTALCERAFQCAAANSRTPPATQFGRTLAECEAMAATNCASIKKCSDFTPDQATQCLQTLAFTSCQELTFPSTPQECSALGVFEIAPFRCDGAVRTTTPVEFCTQFVSSLCDREFECTPVGSRDISFTMTFGSSLAECKAMSSANCPSIDCRPFDSNLASECLGQVSTATCVSLDSVLNTGICQAACP